MKKVISLFLLATSILFISCGNDAGSDCDKIGQFNCFDDILKECGTTGWKTISDCSANNMHCKVPSSGPAYCANMVCGDGFVDKAIGEICDSKETFKTLKCEDIDPTLTGFAFCDSCIIIRTNECKLKNCTDADKFCHVNNGKYWSDVVSAESFDAIESLCKNMGGRVPNISELRTIIKKCNTLMPGGQCSLSDTCTTNDCWNDYCREPQCGCSEQYSDDCFFSVLRDDDNSLVSSSVCTDFPLNVWGIKFYSSDSSSRSDKSVSISYYQKNIKVQTRCIK